MLKLLPGPFRQPPKTPRGAAQDIVRTSWAWNSFPWTYTWRKTWRPPCPTSFSPSPSDCWLSVGPPVDWTNCSNPRWGYWARWLWLSKTRIWLRLLYRWSRRSRTHRLRRTWSTDTHFGRSWSCPWKGPFSSWGEPWWRRSRRGPRRTLPVSVGSR